MSHPAFEIRPAVEHDVPLIRALYPEPAWQWHLLTGRDQANGDKPEVLLTRN